MGLIIDKTGKIDTAKLREDINKLGTKGSYEWKTEADKTRNTTRDAQVFREYNKRVEDALKEWADGVNASSQHLDLSAEAVALRWTSGASLKAEWDLKEHKFSLNGSIEAKAALLEGKIDCKSYFPDKAGQMIKLTAADTVDPVSKKKIPGECYPIGLIRVFGAFGMSGFLGANAGASLNVELNCAEAQAHIRGSKGPPPESGEIDVTKTEKKPVERKFEVEAFAGAEGGASFEGGLEWNSPEATKFVTIAKIGVQVKAQLGAGIKAKFYIKFEKQKFIFVSEDGACFCIGGKAKLEFEVDAENTLELLKYIAYALYATDFHVLVIITKEAWVAYKALPVRMMFAGVDATVALAELGAQLALLSERAFNEFTQQLSNEHARAQLTNNLVDANTNAIIALDYCSPESKGMILYQLIQHTWVTETVYADSNKGFNIDTLDRRKRAIMRICLSLKTKREFENTMQHMTTDGSKVPGGWQNAYGDVRRVLDYGIDTHDRDQQLIRYYNNLAVEAAQQAMRNRQQLPDMSEVRQVSQLTDAIYERLYDKPVLGYAFVSNDSATYFARASMKDHDGFMVAGGYDPSPSEEARTAFA